MADFETMSLDDIRTVLDGGEVPEAIAAAETPDTEQPALELSEDQPEVDEQGDLENETDQNEGTDADDAAETPEAETPQEDQPIPEFKFTADPETDPDKFREEAKAYLATVEVTPQLQTILDANLAPPKEAEPDPLVTDTSQAIDRLATYVDDGNGGFTPDAKGLVEVIEKHFPSEFTAVAAAFLSHPSQKYDGFNKLQEFLTDGFGLKPDRTTEVIEFLQNGAQLEKLPTFTPRGILPKNSEAFWTADGTDRDEIVSEVDRLMFTYERDSSATQEERDEALKGLQEINRRLAKDQKLIDAEKPAPTPNTPSPIESAREASYIETTTAMSKVLKDDVAKSLSHLDPKGARLSAIAIGTLVETAFSDNDAWAKNAQAELAAEGVKFDWTKAKASLNALWDQDLKIAFIKNSKQPHPRALELAMGRRSEIVKELRGLQKDLSGQIVNSTEKSASQQLNEKIKTAPKLKAVRPKGSANAPAGGGMSSNPYQNVSVEELRSRMGEALAREGVRA